MKKTLLASLILVGSLGAASANAANDAVVGAVVGGGMGSLIGHSVGGRDGAVVGGIVGAVAGAALASNSGPRYVNAGYNYGPSYGAPPAYHGARPAPGYYAAPPAPARPVMVETRYYRQPARHPGWDHRYHEHRHWR